MQKHEFRTGARAGAQEQEHRSREQEHAGAVRCARAIGASTMLVAVHSAVEQALHQRGEPVVTISAFSELQNVKYTAASAIQYQTFSFNRHSAMQ